MRVRASARDPGVSRTLEWVPATLGRVVSLTHSVKVVTRTTQEPKWRVESECRRIRKWWRRCRGGKHTHTRTGPAYILPPYRTILACSSHTAFAKVLWTFSLQTRQEGREGKSSCMSLANFSESQREQSGRKEAEEGERENITRMCACSGNEEEGSRGAKKKHVRRESGEENIKDELERRE